MSIEALRTPEERFTNLPDFPYEATYIDDLPGYTGLRMAVIDEGPRDADTVYLCLHGQPTWSFLYRKMIPIFLEDGGRVVAPDWFGFGRSDKPVDDAVYTFTFHRNAIIALIERLSLQSITLVCQDWGGILGLTLPMEMPERFSRLIVMNTALAVGVSPGQGFLDWRAYSRKNPDFSIARLLKRSAPVLSEAEAAAYEAPFPGPRYRAGTRTFPDLVPITPEEPGAALSRRAARWWQTEWTGKSFMAIGEQDPVLGVPVMESLRTQIRDCPPPLIIPEAGHFIQEHGDIVARAALDAFNA